MSDDGKPSGEGKPTAGKPASKSGERQPGDKPGRDRSNGHLNGQAEQPRQVLDLDQRRAERRKSEPRDAEPSVVVPFPRTPAVSRNWLAGLKSPVPKLAWVAVLAVAVLVWGLRKSGI